MALKIEVEDTQAISLDEFKELYRDGKFEAKDQNSLAEAAVLLRRLGNNSEFVNEYIVETLKSNFKNQNGNNYNVGCLVMGALGRDAFLRVNFWASLADYELSKTPDFDVYGIPHDHNFNFLTIGYFGPGYRSKYYEYDHYALDGVIGEHAGLKFIEERQLTKGDILLYRELIDVHDQLPPETLSVTINIMDSLPDFKYIYQYYFDAENNVLDRIICGRSSPSLFDIVGAMADEEANEVLFDIGAQNPCSQTSMRAFKSYIRGGSGMEGRSARLSRVLNRATPSVARGLDAYFSA